MTSLQMAVRTAVAGGIVIGGIVCQMRSFSMAAEPPATIRQITDAESVVAIYRTGPDRGSVALILAAWPDGYAVWSKNDIDGGPPYLAAKISQGTIPELLAYWDNDGIFDTSQLVRADYGPNTEYTTILVKSGTKQVELSSWHEIAETAIDWVATSKGIESLGSRKRLTVLSKQSADYLFFRAVWSDLRWQIKRLIPLEGKSCDGKVAVDRRGLSWVE